MATNNNELKEVYEEVRLMLLKEAEKFELEPQYAYENQTEVETPEAFSFYGQSFSIRESKIFRSMVMGSLDQLKELLDNPVLLKEYFTEIFGTYEEYKRETEETKERETEKEAA